MQMDEYEPEPAMNNYAEINPYYLIYRNMNIRITDSMDREAAENVVRQIGYLHNAMGCVFKDLIKILSFQFISPNPNPNVHPNPNSPNFNHSFQQRPANNRQKMDIQTDSRPNQRYYSESVNGPQSKPQPPKQSGRGQGRERKERMDKQQQKPPNANIFDEFAYLKQACIETKNKDLDSIKIGLTRIVEVVKKKKGEKSADIGASFAYKNLELQGGHHQNSKGGKVNNPMRELLFTRQIGNKRQGDMSREFVHQDQPQQLQHQPQALSQYIPNINVLDRNQQQQGRLWQYLKQKQNPQIFEISDDQDPQL